jgi:hypothetical protein
VQRENEELRRRLVSVNALPASSYGTVDTDTYVAPKDEDEQDED